jgi:hypothetical protein
VGAAGCLMQACIGIHCRHFYPVQHALRETVRCVTVIKKVEIAIKINQKDTTNT